MSKIQALKKKLAEVQKEKEQAQAVERDVAEQLSKEEEKLDHRRKLVLATAMLAEAQKNERFARWIEEVIKGLKKSDSDAFDDWTRPWPMEVPAPEALSITHQVVEIEGDKQEVPHGG